MGWRILGGVEKGIHEGLHGLACLPRHIEKEIHEGLRGLACIPGTVCVGRHVFQDGFQKGLRWPVQKLYWACFSGGF